MMTIGIDIDDTMIKTSECIKNYILNHQSEFEDAAQLLTDVKHIMVGNKISNDTEKFLDQIFPTLIEQVEVRDNSVHILAQLKKDGHKLVLITARSNSNFPRGARLITMKYLKKHTISFDKLITGSLNKTKACLDNHVDIMLDDSVKGCELLEKAGIKTILFTTDINKNIETKIPRVNNWLEIYSIIIETFECGRI